MRGWRVDEVLQGVRLVACCASAQAPAVQKPLAMGRVHLLPDARRAVADVMVVRPAPCRSMLAVAHDALVEGPWSEAEIRSTRRSVAVDVSLMPSAGQQS